MKDFHGEDWFPEDEDFIKWQHAYPSVDVYAEYDAAECWVDANPARRKKNCKSFVNNWLKKAAQMEKGISPFAQKAQEQSGQLPYKRWTKLDEGTHDFMQSEKFCELCLQKYGQYVTFEGERVTR
jgi:hypothetical protein